MAYWNFLYYNTTTKILVSSVNTHQYIHEWVISLSKNNHTNWWRRSTMYILEFVQTGWTFIFLDLRIELFIRSQRHIKKEDHSSNFYPNSRYILGLIRRRQIITTPIRIILDAQLQNYRIRNQQFQFRDKTYSFDFESETNCLIFIWKPFFKHFSMFLNSFSDFHDFFNYTILD